jgi:hypothetical protein
MTMVMPRFVAAGAVLACLVLGFAGCEQSRDEMRPDLDKVVGGEKGMQSRDLREMTDRMAPDLLTIPEIANNPYRAVVVMKSIQNKTENEPGRDFDIYIARLKTLLNSSKCRDRIAFTEDRATLQKIQGEELGGGQDSFEDSSRGGPAPADPRVKPQYALKGIFYSKHDDKTTYYLCTFQLTDLHNGLQVWEGSYEVRTLN